MREDLPPVGGFVLAGGKSSRMGSDKALLELAGKPLVLHATTKLLRVCAEVNVLGGDTALGRFAPLVRDLHPGCGPLGGIEAALRSSKCDWNLVLPVDVPFLPTFLLDNWLWSVLHNSAGEVRLSMLAVDGAPQPALLIIHREIASYLTAFLERGEFKLLPALRSACDEIAAKRNVKSERVFVEMQWDDPSAPTVTGDGETWRTPTEAQCKNSVRWFANLNTPQEFADAERHVDALDT
ncbi:molybdenum cofactor guanylyltransferase [Tunturibacter psychrotolerans]|uniref:Probable molybdenum cofactor guanylyltransferase n=1 Tax=Tunturiibacter psychrotolerans TaxID=3069686 RepID=A0AAU7ZN04_9BACT